MPVTGQVGLPKLWPQSFKEGSPTNREKSQNNLRQRIKYATVDRKRRSTVIFRVL